MKGTSWGRRWLRLRIVKCDGGERESGGMTMSGTSWGGG